jgi:hypothetical protein
MIDKYTSIKEVISKVYRDLNITEERRWEDMIEWAAEALEQIGSFSQYVLKSEELTVYNNRASLPCDFYKIVQLAKGGQALTYLTGSFDTYYHTADSVNLGSTGEAGYTVNSAFFNFNFKEGKVFLSYLAVPTDKEGFPLIPDAISFKEAIVSYIVMKLKYSEYISGTYNPNQYRMLVQEWNHFCGQARGVANMPSLDEMESIKNQWIRLVPEMSRNQGLFNGLNSGERVANN